MKKTLFITSLIFIGIALVLFGIILLNKGIAGFKIWF